MSQESLDRIEKTLQSLCAEVATLRENLQALRGNQGPLTRREITEFLDHYRAAESLGESAFGGWIASSGNACLRGGLRNVQLREASHARLLEARLKELGASPRFELPEAVQSEFLGMLASRESSDLEKLDCFFTQVDVDRTLGDLRGKADRMSDDLETQALLRAIIEDEAATLHFLQQAREQLRA